MTSSPPNATIYLNVPAATKGRWVRASRAAGLRLTDWITLAVEAYMQQQLTKIAIPDAVADDLIAEVLAEDAAGQQISHAPGRA